MLPPISPAPGTSRDVWGVKTLKTKSVQCLSVYNFVKGVNVCDVDLNPPVELDEAEPDFNDLELSPDTADLVGDAASEVGVGLTSECQIELDPLIWVRPPVIFRYDCKDCLQGDPDLMHKCCRVCKSFAASLALESDFEAFVICLQCDIEKIETNYGPIQFDDSDYSMFHEGVVNLRLYDTVTKKAMWGDGARCVENRRLEAETVNQSRRLKCSWDDGEIGGAPSGAALTWLVLVACVSFAMCD